MPFTTVDLHAGAYTADERRAISDALHEAMIEALGIPEDDRIHAFHEFGADTLFHSDVMFTIPRTDRMIFVTFSFNVRSAGAKARLFDTVVEHLGRTAGVGPDEVMIRVLETAKENWWASGRTVDPATGYDSRMAVVE
ncbi:tautomerase family protein [Jatrophihabitans fulvus]